MKLHDALKDEPHIISLQDFWLRRTISGDFCDVYDKILPEFHTDDIFEPVMALELCPCGDLFDFIA